MHKQTQLPYKLVGIVTHSLGGCRRKKEDLDAAEVFYKTARETKGRSETSTAPTCLWTDGALAEIVELRARGLAAREANPTAALLRPREPVKDIDPILAYPEYNIRWCAAQWFSDPRGAQASSSSLPASDLLIHETGTVPMALALTSDKAHVDSQGKAAHRLVITYGLEK